MLGRLGTLQGPFVGVPLAPGKIPFVARCDLIAQVVRNLVDIRANFVDDGNTTYLQIDGRTAIGRHTSKSGTFALLSTSVRSSAKPAGGARVAGMRATRKPVKAPF